MMKRTIGIDLGTTNSCVATVEDGRSVVIVNQNGGRTTPSVVAFTRQGERLVGESAKRQAVTNLSRTVTSVKRRMGSGWTLNVDGKSYNAQQISAFILKQLKQDAESYLGEEVTDAVITVPAYFNDVQRQATKDAGRIAGLNVLRIINEPTSAALAYGLENGQQQKILVYDLGGGTFDVSVIEIGAGVIEVLATCGDNHLGGDDFDARVADWMMSEFRRINNVDLSQSPAALARVMEAAENAKKELSQMELTQIMLPFIAQDRGTALHLDLALSRAKFDELTHDLVEKTAGPVRQALSDAGVVAGELGMVLLVGGCTRMPSVRQKVKELTGIEPSRSINPDECVAQGAALQANLLAGDKTIILGSADKGVRSQRGASGILLLDVCPLSLSIETVGGKATRLINRNTTLPTQFSKVFTTVSAYQSSVEINVLQGERPLAKDNKSIGRFRLDGIQRAPAGVPQIEVTFDIDVNGLLQVSARDLVTRRRQSITITTGERMSEEEIRRAQSEAGGDAYDGAQGSWREAYEEGRRAYDAAHGGTGASGYTRSPFQNAHRHERVEPQENAAGVDGDAASETSGVRAEAAELLRRVDAALDSHGKSIDRRDRKQIISCFNELSRLLIRQNTGRPSASDLKKTEDLTERLKNYSAALLYIYENDKASDD